jgi:pimeloyl-ACP methyl ester carboxylesterase
MTDHVSEVIELEGTRFRHRMISAAGIRFHFVEGGVGPTVVLLAGFPQSWYAWRRVMPILALEGTRFRHRMISAAGMRIAADYPTRLRTKLADVAFFVQCDSRPSRGPPAGARACPH